MKKDINNLKNVYENVHRGRDTRIGKYTILFGSWECLIVVHDHGLKEQYLLLIVGKSIVRHYTDGNNIIILAIMRTPDRGTGTQI